MVDKWIEKDDYTLVCPRCTMEFQTLEASNFCPNCGENMLMNFNLERHNIKRAYPNFTDEEVDAYIKGFEEFRKDVLDIVMKYCPDDDGTCSNITTDLRVLFDDIENI